MLKSIFFNKIILNVFFCLFYSFLLKNKFIYYIDYKTIWYYSQINKYALILY